MLAQDFDKSVTALPVSVAGGDRLPILDRPFALAGQNIDDGHSQGSDRNDRTPGLVHSTTLWWSEDGDRAYNSFLSFSKNATSKAGVWERVEKRFWARVNHGLPLACDQPAS